MRKFNREKIVKLRESLELSMSEFARILGVSRQLVHNWENGVNEPQASTLVSIADKWHLSMDYFFTDDDISCMQERKAG